MNEVPFDSEFHVAVWLLRESERCTFNGNDAVSEIPGRVIQDFS